MQQRYLKQAQSALDEGQFDLAQIFATMAVADSVDDVYRKLTGIETSLDQIVDRLSAR